MTPGDASYLSNQRIGLLSFAAGSTHELGFGWLDAEGRLDASKPVELWITCRMTHVFSLGVLGREPIALLGELATHGVRSLRSHLHDPTYGGWYAAVGAGGIVDAKQAYAHAFVVLAASSARLAGVPGAEELLAEALEVSERRFWDDDEGLVVEEWDRTWSRLDGYRGLNANMHTVEAYLAATDATGDPVWAERARRIAARVVGWAEANDWRIPEHFDASWQPLLEHHADQPAHPFRPYGATVGHGLEWARLIVPLGLAEAALALAERAVADGWSADGAEGFVYTTGWSGVPVVRQRMHWVAAEAVSTAHALDRAGAPGPWAERATAWWSYVDRHLVDHEHGSWHHELDVRNQPAATVWPGKPDVYHAYQAALAPRFAGGTSYAGGLAAATAG